MRYLWLVPTILFGALGALGVLRFVEVLVFGGNHATPLFTLGFGIGFSFLASRSYRRFRRRGVATSTTE